MSRGAGSIVSVRHCGIVVEDLDRSLDFYHGLLDLQIVRELDESGDHLDAMLGLDDVHVKTVKLVAPEGETLVELLHFESHRDKGPRRSIYSTGPTHLALTVDDLDALCARLTEAGVFFNSAPQVSPDGYAKIAFCLDPDGTALELVEVSNPAVVEAP